MIGKGEANANHHVTVKETFDVPCLDVNERPPAMIGVCCDHDFDCPGRMIGF